MSWQCLLSLSIHLTLSIDSDCNGGTCAPLTTVEKQAILDLHNELRDRVAGGGLSSDGHPSATDMNYLIWDEGLEKMAQTYVESCPGLNHNPDPYFLIKNQRDANPQNTKWGTRNGPLSDSRWCGAPSWNSNVDEDCIYIGENLLVTDPRYDLDGILDISKQDGGMNILCGVMGIMMKDAPTVNNVVIIPKWYGLIHDI
eukprot:666479_1